MFLHMFLYQMIPNFIFDRALNFLFFKLTLETYLVTPTPETVFKIHILVFNLLNHKDLPYSNEVPYVLT